MAVSHHQPAQVDEEPKPKRQRTALACDSCRSRKTRCDGARPCCSVCSDMDFRCVYTRPARLSMNTAQEPESSCRIEDRLLALEQILRSVVSKPGLIGQATDIAPERLQESTPPLSSTNLSMGATCKQKDGPSTTYTIGADMLASNGQLNDTVDGMGIITFADEVASGYFGPTSNSAFFYHISNAVKEAGFPSQSAAPAASSTAANYLSRPHSPRRAPLEKHHPTARADPVDCFALPPHAKIIHLANLFFSGTGLLFPYIHKRCVFDGLEEIKMTNFCGVRRSWLCLLNTIMAFATCVTTASHVRKENCAAEADVFLQRALALLPNLALKPANLEAFQALLLVTQYLQGTQHSAQTWNLHGLTVQAAFQIGVHCSPHGEEYSPLEKEIRKRCWYMCFILDKTCSMTFGRPTSISNHYLPTEMPLDHDLEAFDNLGRQALKESSSQGPSTVIVYIHSIKLYKIVADVIEKLYKNNYRASTTLDQQSSSSNLFQQMVSIEPQLAKWKAELPPQLAIKTKEDILHDLQDSSIFSPLSTVITLRYLSTRTLLHRPMIIRFLDHDAQKPGSTEEWSFLKDFGRASLEVGVRSAIEMIEIIYTASEGHHLMLTTWWFSLYYVFSSALIVFAAMVIKHKHGLEISDFEPSQSTNSLQRALDALENLGDDTRIARRCRKYLKKLLQVASAFCMQPSTSLTGKNTSDQAGSAGSIPRGGSYENQIARHGSVDGMALPVSDLSELSPLDMDLGPFVTGTDWDIFTHSMEQDYIGLPFQGDTMPARQQYPT